MAERDFTKTGIKGLDAILGGGIPRGNLILVEGAVGTGKTTLGVEFVYRGAIEFNEPGLIVLFEVSPDKLIRDAALFGWDLLELERQGRLKIVFTTRRVFEQEMQQADSLLLEEAGKVGARRIFIDSFGPPAFGNSNNSGARDPRDALHSLDEMLSGGYFVGSTTLVVGVSGVGKSVMSLQYVAEGARLGERSLMLTLDEPPAQVLRNAASIGIDLQGAIDRGAVQLYYDPPQEIEIDRHFHRIECIVREFKPRRAVIDSLSTYGSSLGAAGRAFRDFFHAIVALMKEHQVTAIYNHENPEMFGMSSMMGDYGVSSLVDNIILLNWV